MSDDINRVSSIVYVTTQINRHVAALMLLFGTVDNILNILVLNNRTFNKTPCTTYLCWSSVSAMVFLWSALLTRVLQGYNVNWPNENRPVCKIRLYLLSVSWAVAIWALVGASIDRFLCSSQSVSYRRLSTNRLARRFIIGMVVVFGLVFIEALYCFEASVPNVPVACYGQSLACRLFNDWMSILVDIVVPSIFLAVFGGLTVRNVQSRVIQPANNPMNSNGINNNTATSRNNDRNLTRMLLVQVFIVLILDLPFGIYRTYASLTSDIPKTSYRIAIENLSYALVILLVFFTHSTAFYLYTLTGTLYRAAFKQLGHLNKIKRIH